LTIFGHQRDYWTIFEKKIRKLLASLERGMMEWWNTGILGKPQVGDQRSEEQKKELKDSWNPFFNEVTAF
jgi:hypothetical protein